MTVRTIYLIVGILLMHVSPVKADVLFSNFPHSASKTFGMGTGGAYSYLSYAVRFNSGSFSGKLSSVEMILASNTTVNVSTYLFSDNGLGTKPGNLISAIGTVPVNTGAAFPAAVYSFGASTAINILPNTNYWVAIDSKTPDSFFRLFCSQDDVVRTNQNVYNDVSVNSNSWINFNNGNNVALRVIGVAVPETPALHLLLIGIFAAVIGRKSFSRGISNRRRLSTVTSAPRSSVRAPCLSRFSEARSASPNPARSRFSGSVC